MGSDKAKAGAIFAPALPFGSKCDYFIFAPSLRALPSHGKKTITMMMSAMLLCCLRVVNSG